MDALLADIRYGVRSLRRRPLFSAVAVITLALGIGANTAIFSLVYGVLLRPLPFPEADRLVMVWQDYSRRGGPEREWWSYPNFRDVRDMNTTLGDMAVFADWGVGLQTDEGAALLRGGQVSSSYFALLGIQPSVGRFFGPEDDLAGGERHIVISHGLWLARFGGRADVAGETVRLDGLSYTVLGVLPPRFVAPVLGDVKIWTTMMQDRSAGRGEVTMRAIGRLAPGVTIEEAATDLAGVASRLERAWPGENADVGIAVHPLRDEVVGVVAAPLWVLFGIVSLVLLIACANVANLMLARATERGLEVAVRASLGAGRARLLRQFLTESTLLALLGGGFGLLLALWGVEGLVQMVPASVAFPRLQEIGVNTGVLVFAALLVVLASLLFGSAPALRAARLDTSAVLKGGAGRGYSGSRTGGYRAALVVLETAFSLTALIGAGLLLRSFQRLQHVDPGFEASGVLTANTYLPEEWYGSADRMRSYLNGAVERLGALPGVEAAATVSTLPLSGNATDASFRIVGDPEPQPGRAPVAWYRQIMPGYLALMRIPLRAGRYLDDSDHEGAPLTVCVNETFVRRYFPDGNAVGRQLAFGGDLRATIVGVTADIRHFGLSEDPPPAMYLSVLQFPARPVGFVVRTAGDPLAVAEPLRRVLNEIDPRLPVFGTAALAGLVRDAVAPQRVTALLVLLFALLALALATVGLYGVMSYAVTRRSREIGVRMALGAESWSVVGLMVRQGMQLACAGALLGLAGGYVLAVLMRGLLFNVGVSDPATYVGVSVALLSVALLATWLPARRASRVDPVNALRHE